jgi:hypothetical protein
VSWSRGRGCCRFAARCLVRSTGYNAGVILLWLSCSSFWVDVRLWELNGRWIASADTPDGASLGLGKGAIEAVEHALEPNEGPDNRWCQAPDLTTTTAF